MRDGGNMQGYPINWDTQPSNTRLLRHPLYIKYSSYTFNQVNDKRADIIGDIKGALANQEGAEIIAYLSWLLRTTALFA